MRIFLKNYKSSIIMFLSIIIGTLAGLIFKEKTNIVKPLGDLFLNLLLVIIVPLVFLTISTSIGKMKSQKRISKILITIFVVFIFGSLVSVFIGFISTKFTLIEIEDNNKILQILSTNETEIVKEELNILERTINTISVNNFSKILTNDNLIALIVFSILVGISINMSKERGKTLLYVLDSANTVIQKFINIIMIYAPIGLGCYFASLVGNIGSSIVYGYTKTFIIYTVTCILFYFIIYSIYAFVSGGKKGFIIYWKNILPPTLTALATCSSAASIPINTKAAKNIGVPEDIADTTIPLGTSFHKDGSVIGSVFKIMFLVYLFNSNISTFQIIGVSLLATLLVTAVPIGGGTISEILIFILFTPLLISIY